VRGPGARVRALFGVLWIAVFCCGLAQLGHQTFSVYLDQFPGFKAAERQNVRLFLATGEPAVLE